MYLSDRELSRSEYFNDFLLKQSLFYSMSALVNLEPKRAAFVTLLRSKEAGPFEESERDGLSLFLPHLTRAFRLHTRLASLRASYEAMNSLCDALVLLGPAGKVVFANAAATRIFAQKDGIELAAKGIVVA